MKYKCCIYKLTFPHGKIYIGQTTDFVKRMYVYKTSKKKGGLIISRAIQKYGWDNVKVEIMLYCSSDMLDYYETALIKKFDSENPKIGYNRTPGGQAGSTSIRGRYRHFKRIHKPIWQFDGKTGYFEKWYPNAGFAAKVTNTDQAHILGVLNGNDLKAKGKIFVYADEKISRPKKLPEHKLWSRTKYTYYTYNLDTKEIKQFGSFSAMQNYINPSVKVENVRNKIKKAMNKPYIRYGYFIHKVLRTETVNIKEIFDTTKNSKLQMAIKNRHGIHGKHITVENITTKEQQEFISINDAARSLNLNAKRISEALNRSRKHKKGNYKGYYWKFEVSQNETP